MARSLGVLGRIAFRQGNFQEAVEKHNESLVLFRELGEKLGVIQALEKLGSVAVEPDPIRAARLLGAATGARETIGAPLPAYERAEHDAAVNHVRALLDGAVFSAAWADGRAMTLEQAIEYALAGEGE